MMLKSKGIYAMRDWEANHRESIIGTPSVPTQSSKPGPSTSSMFSGENYNTYYVRVASM